MHMVEQQTLTGRQGFRWRLSLPLNRLIVFATLGYYSNQSGSTFPSRMAAEAVS